MSFPSTVVLQLDSELIVSSWLPPFPPDPSIRATVTGDCSNLKPVGAVRITLPVVAVALLKLDTEGPVSEVQVLEPAVSAEMALPPVAAVSVTGLAPANWAISKLRKPIPSRPIPIPKIRRAEPCRARPLSPDAD
jgi:hypothetical protein